MDNDVQSIRRSLSVLTTLSVFVVAYFARDLILPIMLGFLIALTLSPINRSIQKTGLPAVVSAVLLVVFAAVGMAVILYFAGGAITSWGNDAPAIIEQIKQKLSGINEIVVTVQEASEEIEQMAGDVAGSTQPVAIQPPALLNSAVTIAASTITSLSVALILALFLLASGDMFYQKLTQAFPTLSGKKRALSTVYAIERQVSGYLLTITLINAGLGVIVAVCMWMIGLEYAYIWGIAAFLLNYLPVLGGIIGTILVGLYAIVSLDSFSYALLAPIVYQLLTSSEAQFVTPYILGRRMELNIVAVFLTVVLWGWLWGIAGVIVAVPFLLVFKVVCDNFDSLSVMGNFLSSGGDAPMSETAERT